MAHKKSKVKRTGARPVAKVAAISIISESGGQSGDLQGLPDNPTADSESVQELAAEGQAFEAALVNSIEDAPPADAAEVTTKEVPEDDIPREYLEQSKETPKE
jgi:hypothetical protein